MNAPKNSQSTPDPVRIRRAMIAVWTKRANRLGYLLFAASIALFIVAFTVDFNDTMVTFITICMVLGSILLAPAIVLGYAVKAAEKALNEKGADFDYGSAAARLAEAAAQLRTVQQIRKKFGG